MDTKCPRADANDWRNTEIVEIACACGERVEFWKGDEERPCSKCGKPVKRISTEVRKDAKKKA